MRCPPDPSFLGVLPQKSEPIESAVEKVTSLAVRSTRVIRDGGSVPVLNKENIRRNNKIRNKTTE